MTDWAITCIVWSWFSFPVAVHFISIKPVLSDHLSYVTIFHCSRGRSYKTGLTVLVHTTSSNWYKVYTSFWEMCNKCLCTVPCSTVADNIITMSFVSSWIGDELIIRINKYFTLYVCTRWSSRIPMLWADEIVVCPWISHATSRQYLITIVW